MINNNNNLIIMIHGFTSSNYNFHFMDKYFKDLGYKTYVPLLQGHDSLENLEKYLPIEWYENLKFNIIKLLKDNEFNEVNIVGLSMGGAFAIRLVHELKILKIKVNKLVLLATPYRLKIKHQIILSSFGYNFFEIFHYYHRKKSSDIKNKIQRTINSNFKKIPTRSIFGLHYFLRENKTIIKKINIPTLIIHSKKDHTISWKQGRYIYKKISSKNKKFIPLKKSYHIIPLDVEREYIFDLIFSFIK